MSSRSLGQSGTRRVTAGDLSTPIALEREVRTADGYKGATKHWQPVADVWAFPEPIYVDERERHGSLRNVVQYRFTVYATDEIDAAMRILWNGDAYNIKGIRRGGANEIFMDIIAETGLGD